MKKRTGRFTIPSERNFLEETKALAIKWGADAIRDSDGTKLDDQLKQLGLKVYTTYFVARNHNEFAKKHLEELQSHYLLSKRVLASSSTVEIPLMEGFFDQQIAVKKQANPKKYWEVIDRTTGHIVPVKQWTYDEDNEVVIVNNITPFHEYTCSFLADALWDPTQMYNHTTNNWGDAVEHDIPFDVRYPNSYEYMVNTLKQFVQDNPHTDVVRFTTFYYHFTLFFNNLGKEKFVDWFGYSASVSQKMLDDFEQARGYRLRAEDIVDEGYYNTAFRMPTKAYRDFMDFQMQFVADKAAELVQIVHDAGKEAIMFLGDNWIGIEPYGPYFEKIGLDAVVGSVGSAATLRMISEIPHVKYTEGRFLPYFFPDTFHDGGNPVVEAQENWLCARRAILQKPVDRIGYGGYLSLAAKFPDFVDYVEYIAEEFRSIHEVASVEKSHRPLKVGYLNAWGSLRSWQTHMVAHALPYKQIDSYLGILEALAGYSVETVFLSFDDVIENGLPEDLDVLINAGDQFTAFSGGEIWKNSTLVSTIRSFVHNGGGFIGVGQPSFYPYQGRSFQLADVMGVDQELGFSLSTNKYFHTPLDSHFVTQGLSTYDFGESMKNVYALSENTEIIEYSNREIHLAANSYGKGRGMYLAGLPYTFENGHLFYRMLMYTASREDLSETYYATHSATEVVVYPKAKKVVLINNSPQDVVTTYYDGQQKAHEIELVAGELKWLE